MGTHNINGHDKFNTSKGVYEFAHKQTDESGKANFPPERGLVEPQRLTVKLRSDTKFNLIPLRCYKYKVLLAGAKIVNYGVFVCIYPIFYFCMPQ